MPSSRGLDRVLGWLSFVYGAICLLLIALCMIVLMPLYFVRVKRTQAANVSTEEGGSLSAVKTLNARAVAAACGFGPDHLAIPMIAKLSLTGGGGGGWLFTQAYWRSLVLGFRLTRRLYVDQAMRPFLDKLPFGEITYMHLRTCWLDDVVEQFIASLDGGLGQLVILGAGYDSRCRRLGLPDNVRGFEVDAPGTQARKRALLEELGRGEGDLTYVTCDFARERWIDKLHREGFDFGVPSCFVWEGVSMYLTPEVVAETLKAVRMCAPGSMIGFDYILHKIVLAPSTQSRTKRAGEPWLFGLKEGEQEGFVAAQGLEVLDHLRHEELLRRYMPRRADGSSMGVIADFGGFLLAGRRP